VGVAASRALPLASRARLAKTNFIPNDEYDLDPTVYHCDTCEDALTREETFVYRNGQFCWSCKDWYMRTGKQYASSEPESRPVDIIDLVDSEASPPARQRRAAACLAPQVKEEIIDLTHSPPINPLVFGQAREPSHHTGLAFENGDPMDSDDPVGIFSDHASSSDDPVDIFSDHALATAPSSDDPVETFSDVSDPPIAPRGPAGALQGPLVPCYTLHCMAPLHRVTRYIVAYLSAGFHHQRLVYILRFALIGSCFSPSATGEYSQIRIDLQLVYIPRFVLICSWCSPSATGE
jgi:hypothetical protein